MYDHVCIPSHSHHSPGWWYTYPSEKYEFVHWDDEIPYGQNNPVMFQENHQPESHQYPNMIHY